MQSNTADGSMQDQIDEIFGLEDEHHASKLFMELLSQINQEGRIGEFIRNIQEDQLDQFLDKIDQQSSNDASSLIPRIYVELGKLYRRSRKIDKAEDYYLVALKRYSANGDQQRLYEVQLKIANLKLALGQFKEAKQRYIDLLDNSNIGNRTTALCYLNFATCVYNQGDIDSSKKYLAKIPEIISGTSDEDILADVRFNQGIIEMNQRNFDTSLNKLKQAKTQYYALDNTRAAIICDEHLIKIYTMQNRQKQALELATSTLPKISVEQDYRLFCRIMSLVIDLFDDQKILEWAGPFLKEIELSTEEPQEVFEVIFEFVRICIKHSYNLELVGNKLEQLYEIADTLDDPEALRAIYLQRQWYYYRKGMADKLLIELSKRQKDKTLTSQERFELGTIAYLSGEFDRSLDFIDELVDLSNWEDNSQMRVNIIYTLNKIHQDKQEEVLDIFNSLPALLQSNSGINILMSQKDYSSELVDQQTISSLIGSEDIEECLKFHIQPKETSKKKNCEQEPCPELLNFIFENIN